MLKPYSASSFCLPNKNRVGVAHGDGTNLEVVYTECGLALTKERSIQNVIFLTGRTGSIFFFCQYIFYKDGQIANRSYSMCSRERYATEDASPCCM